MSWPIDVRGLDEFKIRVKPLSGWGSKQNLGIELWLQLEPVLLSGQGDYDFDGVQYRTEAARCIHADPLACENFRRGAFVLLAWE